MVRQSSVLLLLFGFLLVGCASIPRLEGPERLPKLVYQEPLPAYSGNVKELRLDIRVRVAADGSVEEVDFLRSSGDRSWDSLAIHQIRKWRYSPAMAGGEPIPLWIMQTIRVQFMPPSYMDLAEIVCPTKEVADSLYTRLRAGEDFVTLARTCSLGPTKDQGGILGEVDLRTYPMGVQEVLRKLQEGMITEPLEIGNQFVIFKRLSRVTPSFGS